MLVDLSRAKVVRRSLPSPPTAIAITADGKRAVWSVWPGELGAPGSLELVPGAGNRRESVPVAPFEELALDETGRSVVQRRHAGPAARLLAQRPAYCRPRSRCWRHGRSRSFPHQDRLRIQAVGILSALTVAAPTAAHHRRRDRPGPPVGRMTYDSTRPRSLSGTAAPNRGTVLVAVTVGGRLVIREYGLEDKKAVLKDSFDAGESQDLFAALSVTYDNDHTALLTWPKKRAVIAVDLDDKSVRTIDWTAPNGKVGPADITLSFTP